MLQVNYLFNRTCKAGPMLHSWAGTRNKQVPAWLVCIDACIPAEDLRQMKKKRFVGATLAVALSRRAINDGINYM
jgi:hypothetical protein